MDWSKDEVELTVDAYFHMLTAEINGVEYSKSQYRKELLGRLNNRSEGAIEFKNQNISAILERHGYPFIQGYKPLGNIQALLQEEVLKRVVHDGLHLKQAFSWKVLTDDVAIKNMDKSAFIHKGTGVPKEIAFFFGASSSPQPKSIVLQYKGKTYDAHLVVDPHERLRMLWRSDFAEQIRCRFPAIVSGYSEDKVVSSDNPQMRFERARNADHYKVEFISTTQTSSPQTLPDEYDHVVSPRIEGDKRRVVSTVYERDRNNRLRAIQYHGTVCSVCGFDFGTTYGELGQGFVEIHHVRPLSETNTKHEVDPRVDLLPVCANCHRMLHRRQGRVLTVDELKMLMRPGD